VERLEDYLEAIYDIQFNEGKVAKTNDLAKRLNVRPSTVTEMLSKLSKKGYIKYQPYYGAVLTKKGEKIAKRVKKYNKIFKVFFEEFLKLDKETSQKLSCEVEHHINDDVAKTICKIISELCNFCEECAYKSFKLSEAPPGVYKVLFAPAILTKIGIAPKKKICVNEKGNIIIGKKEVNISKDLASWVVIEPIEVNCK